MREYGKVSPQFWMGDTGKKIRAAGMEAQIVGLYLLTNPHANMLGLYYLPITFICHETGLPFEGASKALASLSKALFCQYDEGSEVVWVFEMAKFQIADSLKPADNRCAGIQREYDQLPANPYLARFFEKYQESFHLTECRGETTKKGKGLARGSKAPPKPRAGAGAGTREEEPLSGKPDDVAVLDYLNERAGKAFRSVPTTLDPIRVRLESGVTVEQCRQVIDAKVAEWGSDPEMEKYLRPATLFGATKFEQYLGALGTVKAVVGVPEYVRRGYGSALEMQQARGGRVNAKELSGMLAENASGIAAMLLPNGKKHGAEWKAGSVAGDAGNSLSVRLTGDKRGLWADFATGESGDLLDLWVACRGVSLGDAIRDAKAFLGVKQEMPARVQRPYSRPEKPRCTKPKSAVLEWLHARGFEDRTIEAFALGAAGDDVVVLPYKRDGELVNVKQRSIHDKSKMWQAKDAEPCLFGWHTIDDRAREVCITEGEFDAMALWQQGIPALSVNQGAGNHQWIDSDWDRLERFSKIHLCFDDDAAGKKGVAEVAQRLGPDRCFVVTFPEKDANEYLKVGGTPDQFRDCIKRATTFDPVELVRASAFLEEIIAEFYPEEGHDPTPCLQLGQDQPWFRFRAGEVSVWTGYNGHGKSQMLGQVILGMLDQGERACIFSGEMLPRRFLKRMFKQVTGFSEPAVPFLRKVSQWMDDKLWVFNFVGSANSKRLIDVFTYGAKRYGITHFVVDSLMMIEDIPEDGKGCLEASRQFMILLANFAKKYNVHVHLVAHPRKGADEKQAPGKQDTAGSGKITNMADNHWSVWANLRDENEAGDDGPDAYLELNKQRNGDSQHRKLWLWFDQKSQQYRSIRAARPKQFVQWSPNETERA